MKITAWWWCHSKIKNSTEDDEYLEKDQSVAFEIMINAHLMLCNVALLKHVSSLSVYTNLIFWLFVYTEGSAYKYLSPYHCSVNYVNYS